MSENMYSADEAAQILGLQVRTVRNYVREGRLPGVRIGKQYRIARADLEAFTAAGVTQGALLGLDPPPTAAPPLPPMRAPDVTSVVQIDGIDAAPSERIRRTLAAAIMTDEHDRVEARVESIYDEQRRSLKVIIVGATRATVDLLRIVDALASER